MRNIAFYLPQYYPIPENDQWWGPGFTEWTNTSKARPLFRGHYQPHVPADLGFYDLRVPETRQAQADLARQYGIGGFCYYHYWFGNGRRLLDRPFNEVLKSGEPDFPFCLCWANQSWTGIWHGLEHKVLIEQTYPGLEDYREHFNVLLKAFTDPRYITVNGCPIFVIYRPHDIPDVLRVTDFWRSLALESGLKGLHLVGVHENADWDPRPFGFDASITPRLPELQKWKTRWYSWRQPGKKVTRWLRKVTNMPAIYDYAEEWQKMLNSAPPDGVANYPCLIPNWDNTPRSGANGMVLVNSTPELFGCQVRRALELVVDKPAEERLIFVKAWNEWAEGNHLEPDQQYGHGHLKAIQKELELFSEEENKF